MTKLRQRGFSAVEFLLIVVFLAVIAGVSYFVVRHNRNGHAQSPVTTSASTAPTAPTVNSTGDLDSADKALDQTNLNTSTSDGAQLDSLTNGF